LNYMQLPQKQILNKDAMIEWVKLYKPKLTVMCGAGDIELLIEDVKEILTNE
jgi:UDP-N-acetylmuramate--alanine ligase